MVRYYHGHTYRVMPFALERRKYRDALRDWHSRYGSGPGEGDREYEDYLERLYAEAADHNAYENAAKSEYLFRANTSVVCCVISAAVTFVPFAIHRVLRPAVVLKVEITNESAAASHDQETRNVKRGTESSHLGKFAHNGIAQFK